MKFLFLLGLYFCFDAFAEEISLSYGESANINEVKVTCGVQPQCSYVSNGTYCGYSCEYIGASVYCGDTQGSKCSYIDNNVYCGVNCKYINNGVYCGDQGLVQPAKPAKAK